MNVKSKIYPCLWFDGKAKEAADFYCSNFQSSKITAATPMVVTFESSGQKFICLNGGPQFKCNPSISFFYICETEDEINSIWNEFLKHGSILMPLNKYPWSEKYGWVQDKYGVSWQFSFGKIKEVGQKITPCLMFVGEQYGRAEEAIYHYSSIFKNSKVDGILRYGDDESPDKEGAVKHAQFSLSGQKFMVMESNHNHNFMFNEAISLVVDCETQEEIDYYWNKLTEDGKESMCGWLSDKFGVSWQVIPTILGELMGDPEKAPRVMQSFMSMKKFDIQKLKQA